MSGNKSLTCLMNEWINKLLYIMLTKHACSASSLYHTLKAHIKVIL